MKENGINHRQQPGAGGDRNRLEALYRISLAVSSSLSPARVVGGALTAIREIVSPDSAIIYLRRGKELILLDASHAGQKTAPLLPERKKSGVCLCGLAALGEDIFSLDIRGDRRCCLNECRDAGVLSFAALPLKSGDEVVGVLGLASRTPRDFAVEADFLRAIASLVAVGLKNALLHDQVATQARELEERIRSQEEAETWALEEKHKLEAVLSAIQDGITVQDTDYRVIYQNHVHREKNGDQLGEFCYQAYYDRSDVCDDCPMARSLADGRIHRQEVKRTTSKGEMFLEITASPVRDADGRIVAAVEVIRDVTRQKQLSSQLLQAQKMESIGRLAGGVAHDFNNILTTIMGYSDLAILRLGTSDPETKSDLEQIRNAGEKAAILTRQLLAFSRKQSMEPRILDLNRLISDMSKMLERMIGEDVVLDFRPGEDLPMIKGDPAQLEQVLMNLAVNARDAMPGGGHLAIETRAVEIGRDQSIGGHSVAPGRYVMLTVADDGCGIPPEIREKVFDPFFTTKEPGKGTGLGLATVFGIVKQHGGAIHLYSEVGRGTAFKIYLPAGDGEKESEEAGEAASPPMAHGSETILVVDDEPLIRTLAVDTLAPLGYNIIGAASGDEALEILGRTHAPVDLLISDIIMPGMHGAELARRVREIYPGIRVLFMTGYLDSTVMEGMDPEATVLVKPLSPSALAASIRRALDGSGEGGS